MSIEKDEAVNESIDVKPSIRKSRMKLKTLLEPLKSDSCSNESPIVTEELGKSYTFSVSMIEFAIINNFLFRSFSGEMGGIKATSYGTADEYLSFGGVRNDIRPWWFNVNWALTENALCMIQTRQFRNSYGYLCHDCTILTQNGLKNEKWYELKSELLKIAYNNSEYKGKCLKITLIEGRFDGIEIIDTSNFNKNIILSKTQKRFLKHYINRVRRGSTARYLLNGTPGTGKTESIRKIIFELMGEATFIIPDFGDVRDLIQILEACNVFEPGVLIIDDIDLYLGSRDRGGYTAILGQFLSFFDGIKKNKISIIASTNDKGLVDKAAERPGRFNLTLDFGYLEDDQIEEVCKIHLDETWLVPEVFAALKGKDSNGKKVKITGAFIANLAENIREMAADEPEWNIDDTIVLIKESYRGFYSSQVEPVGKPLGFNLSNS